ncbi:MAG TPA: DNA recombination protein RmuC [Acidobacteriaceae bacterium]|jgi:DNA recombination protein RmuC|nr:DNA recombination protein RmuC [Acidobacteriaceae bacterium]
MLLALAALQLLLLFVITAMLWRRPKPEEDARLTALLGADLPTQMARTDGRLGVLDEHMRAGLAVLRNDAAEEAQRSRDAADRAAAALRTEVLGNIQALGEALRTGLDSFRTDNARGAEGLRQTVDEKLGGLEQRFLGFATDMAKYHGESRDALHARLNELGQQHAVHQEKLRGSVEDRLDRLNQANTAKLEEMRQTVDEKLHATLQTRLTESFGQVTDQLTKVHAGLGEMNTLTAGVNDLNRIFSNVKSRGGFAEMQLGKLLEQVLAPGQYVENARVKPGTQEMVEYAVRFPGTNGDVLLPIDAKFPREAWERLESAYEQGLTDEIEAGRRAFDAAIRTEGKRICSKYINEPVTTPYAIMFLPTESLYAEVLRRDGLQSELHLNCKVMVAGPSNLYALLTSFQFGFRMLNLQKKGDEVWNVLGAARTEFGKFGNLMEKMENDVGRVQKTIGELNTRTRVINRKLRDVAEVDQESDPSLPLNGMLPMLAAEADE